MDFAMTIIGGWLALSVVTAFAVATFIRVNRGDAGFPVAVRYAAPAVIRRSPAAPRP